MLVFKLVDEQKERERNEQEAIKRAAAAPDREKILEAIIYLENIELTSIGANKAISEACYILEQIVEELK